MYPFSSGHQADTTTGSTLADTALPGDSTTPSNSRGQANHTVNRNREGPPSIQRHRAPGPIANHQHHQGRPAVTMKTYSVTGMSCNHCVRAVTTELNRLGGEVTIDLVPDGTSQITVTSHTPLPDDAIRQALSEAGGYQLTTP
jgi:copper chaperone